MLSIDEEIFLNQLSRKIVAKSDGIEWFTVHGEEGKRRIILGLNFLIVQARPRPSDSLLAVEKSGFRKTLSPCLLLVKQPLKIQLAKMAWLPERELESVFCLLIELLSIADERRRIEEPLDLINHWWHRDLSDQQVIEDIRRNYNNSAGV